MLKEFLLFGGFLTLSLALPQDSSALTKQFLDLSTAGAINGSPEGKEKLDLVCRKGYGLYPIPTKYFLKFEECKARLNALTATRECIHVCMWNDLKFADPTTGQLNRTAVLTDPIITDTFPDGPDVAGRTEFVDDMEACWNAKGSKPNLDDKSLTCEGTKKFTNCFSRKSITACGK